MRFKPMTEEEIQVEGLLPEGNYQFEVAEAQERISKAGNEMIELKLKIWDKDGNVRVMYDYILEAFAMKLKHFCDVAGLSHKYQDGTLQPEDCLGKGGYAWIIRQAPQGGYDAKNSVKDYIVKPEAADAKAKPAGKDDFHDDDIPF